MCNGICTRERLSIWLMAQPVKEYGLLIHKGEFLDAIDLRYGWTLVHLLLTCACGAKHTVNSIYIVPMTFGDKLPLW